MSNRLRKPIFRGSLQYQNGNDLSGNQQPLFSCYYRTYGDVVIMNYPCLIHLRNSNVFIADTLFQSQWHEHKKYNSSFTVDVVYVQKYWEQLCTYQRERCYLSRENEQVHSFLCGISLGFSKNVLFNFTRLQIAFVKLSLSPWNKLQLQIL